MVAELIKATISEDRKRSTRTEYTSGKRATPLKRWWPPEPTETIHEDRKRSTQTEYTSDKKATLLMRRHADTGVVNIIRHENEVKREVEDPCDRGSERRSYQARGQRFPLEGGARRLSNV